MSSFSIYHSLNIVPLVLTSNEYIIALDVKLNFDDDSLFRRKDVEKFRDIEVRITVPLVVRLEETNVELGRKMLSESGLKVQTVLSMKEGAVKVVEVAKVFD